MNKHFCGTNVGGFARLIEVEINSILSELTAMLMSMVWKDGGHFQSQSLAGIKELFKNRPPWLTD